MRPLNATSLTVIAALSGLACADTTAGDGSTSTEGGTGSTGSDDAGTAGASGISDGTSTGPGDGTDPAGTDTGTAGSTGGDFSECFDEQDPALAHFVAYLDSETWMAEPNPEETISARCSVLSKDPERGGNKSDWHFSMECTDHRTNNTHSTRLMFGEDAIGDRLDFIVGTEVEMVFQAASWYSLHGFNDVIIMRDDEGNLLLATGIQTGLTESGWDGESLVFDELHAGLPLGWTYPNDWNEPLVRIETRDNLCPGVPAGEEDGGGFKRRFAIEVEDDAGGVHRVFDQTAAQITLGAHPYEIRAGEITSRWGTGCADCSALALEFLVVRR